MRQGGYIALVWASLSCSPALAQAPPEPDLGCTGPFARNADTASLSKAFGRTNVTRADIDVGEGMTQPGTVLFGKEPGRRLDILWHDSLKRRRPSVVFVRDASRWGFPVPGAPGRRIAIGMTLAEVEAANGGPFTILGFEWDGGGFAGDWRGGRLARLEGGCSLSLNFDPDLRARGADLPTGDAEFASSDPAMRAAKPVVSRILLGWPD